MSADLKYKYYLELSEESRKRYDEKIDLLGGVDPYFRMDAKSTSSAVEWMDWPDVMHGDIFNYLILTPGYTFEQLLAYKSLDGYNFFINGWVTNVVVTHLNIQPRSFLFTAAVKHSQKLSLPSLQVWVAIKPCGEVMCAHCTCMAGVGEVCSHVAAVLFAAEGNTLIKRQFSVTSLPCSWLPAKFKFVSFSKVADIDFITPNQKRKVALRTSEPEPKRKAFTFAPPTDTDLSVLHSQLSTTSGKPVMLSHTEGFSDPYIPTARLPNFPKSLTELFDPNTIALAYPELLQKCDEVYDNLFITADQAELVERHTRKQSSSRVWFQQRAGRVTASKLKNVLSTNISQPSTSLIKSICYPDKQRFTSAACSYGCKHEDAARNEYMYEMKKKHSDFKISEVGLVLHPLYPFLGATPDGLVSCSCHGDGTLEIKCPYSCREKDLEQVAEENSNFFLVQDDDGILRLKETHQYYYQVQMQMKFCNVQYCDFVVWNKDVWINQRIELKSEFIDDAISRTESFIRLGILPELVGKWYTKPGKSSHTEHLLNDDTESTDQVVVDEISCEDSDFVESQGVTGVENQEVMEIQPTTDSQQFVNSDDRESSDQDEQWCYCGKGESEGSMIGCDNDACPRQWFHLSCLHLTLDQVPKGKWYCPECRHKKTQK